MQHKKNKGFTLIELLVVIAIIGILASVVLASLSSARTKGQATAIQSEMNNMRAQAELYYSTNGINYGTGYTATTGTGPTGALINPTASCTAPGPNSNAMFSTGASSSGLFPLVSAICSAGATAITVQVDQANATKWALQAVAPGGNGYCVDSSGVLKSYVGTPTAFTSANPGTCL